MNNKYIYLTITIIIAAVIHPIYIIDRLETVKNQKISGAVSQIENLVILQRNKSGGLTFEQLYTELNSGAAQPAGFIISGHDKKNISVYFDNDVLNDNPLKNQIMDEFKKSDRQGENAEYSIKSLTRSDSADPSLFIIVERKTQSGLLFAAFSADINSTDVIILILENILILALIISGASIIYIANSRKMRHNPGQHGNQQQINIPDTEKAAYTAEPRSEIKNLDPLSSLVYEFFTRIFPGLSPDEMSLYLYNRPGRLTKVYELKGSRLIKIDGGAGIELSPDSVSELKNSSYVLTDAGRDLHIPMKKLDTLIGLVRILRTKPLSYPEIQGIITEAKALLKPMSDQISLNEIMVDPETGLYSEAYLKLRTAELINSYTETHGEFQAAAISLFSKEDAVLQREDFIRAVKTITPAIMDLTGSSPFVSLKGDYIVIVFPDRDLASVSPLIEKILRELDRYRIKIRQDLTVQIHAIAGICGSRESADDIIAEAIKRISKS